MALQVSSKRTKQWKVVLISFMVATTFWFFNALNKTYTTSLTHPVKFVFDRDSLQSVVPLPDNITLDVTGGGWSLLRRTAIFIPKPIQIGIENPTEARVMNWLELLPTVREQFDELQINQILQDTLRIRIEPRLSRAFALALDTTTLVFEDNYQRNGPIRLSRDSILLEGPASFFDTLSQPYVIPFTDEQLDDSFDDEIPVWVPSPLIRPRPKEITVEFPVVETRSGTLAVPVLSDSGDTLQAVAEVVYAVGVDQQVRAEHFDVRLVELPENDSTAGLELRSFKSPVLSARLRSKRIPIQP